MLALVALGGWVVLAQIYGVYDNDQAAVARSTADDVPGIVLLTTFVTWISLLSSTSSATGTRSSPSRPRSGAWRSASC